MPTLLRSLEPSDYEVLSPLINDWWGGRPVRALLPRLFFDHFASTSFALIDGAEIQAFLVGFRSQSHPTIAYIHFAGVAPTSRGRGYGSRLYTHFFDHVASLGCQEVHCITSPINTGSIAFHQRLGFTLVSTGYEQDGIPIYPNHAGDGQHRVLFHKSLIAPS